MLRNYLKIAWRNLRRNKIYSLINIVGLSIGLACFAFISLWISDEWSHDRFHEKAERIYRVAGRIMTDSENFELACTAVPMGPALLRDYSEVENFVRLSENGAVVKQGNLMFDQEGIFAADPSFFDIFSYQMTDGDPKTALQEPYSVILTESMARKYFGEENPIGRTLRILLYDPDGRGMDYKVTGVMPDASRNAHFTFNFLVSFESLIASDRAKFASDEAWGGNGYYTYILLREGVDYKTFESRLPQFYEKHVMPLVRKHGGTKPMGGFFLQPLTDIHLKSKLRYEINPTGSLVNLYIFGTVGLFILLIAGINYVNLATAQSMKRAKEVGIKKVVGASKVQLTGQYLLEAIFLALVSLLCALGVCQLLQPIFHYITDKDIAVFNSPVLLGFLFLVSVVAGLLAGLYPALFISSYRPTVVLKGSFSTSTKGVWLRKSLVTLQFTITIVLLVGILIIRSQLAFIKNKNLGYDKDALLNLKVNGDIDVMRNIEAFKDDLLKNPSIKGVTTSNSILVGGMGDNGATTVDKEGRKIQSSIYRLKVDYDFVNTLGLRIIEGRNFSRSFPADAPTDSTQNYVLNEAAVRAFGWESVEKAIGKPFEMNDRNGKVVGIVNDFHFNSLQHKVEPLVMVLRDGSFSRIILRIDMQKPQDAISSVESLWRTHFPTSYLEYDFIDKKLGEQYAAEARFSAFFLYFSIISVLIACLGLYGLVSFAAQQRTKEIGIRKVLGASLSQIAVLLSKDFLKLVLVAFLIATPIAWYAMNQWLQDFAYRITLEWWVFALAGLLALAVALLTVSFQAVKAALANPVKSLRSE